MSKPDRTRLGHVCKNVSLILLSLLLLPLDSVFVLSILTLNRLRPPATPRRRAAIRADASFRPRVILVTGVGMAKGLALARALHSAGHTVLGADFRPNGAAGSGRASASLAAFHPLDAPDPVTGPAPYIDSLLTLILTHHVELWVSCSGVASAVEDGLAAEAIEAHTPCRTIQLPAPATRLLHEKHSFIAHVRALGLPVPETHAVSSHAEVLDALRDAPEGRRYILKPIGVDDANRGDMSLLPRPTPEETRAHVQALRIAPDARWILQQFVRGAEYCTHALVVRGEVRAFVACPSAELLMHYEALPADSPLSRAMLAFTERVAREGGEGFTGHVSFDFMVEDEAGEDDGEPEIFPIECNPRAHTAVVLFAGTEAMAGAYLGLLGGEGLDGGPEKGRRIVRPERSTKYFWVGHDLGVLGDLAMRVLRGQGSVGELAGEAVSFVGHVLLWRDGTFAWWDPLPWWWLYHVYWPMQFLGSLRSGKRWSRVNVSTNKVFEC